MEGNTSLEKIRTDRTNPHHLQQKTNYTQQHVIYIVYYTSKNLTEHAQRQGNVTDTQDYIPFKQAKTAKETRDTNDSHGGIRLQKNEEGEEKRNKTPKRPSKVRNVNLGINIKYQTPELRLKIAGSVGRVLN